MGDPQTIAQNLQIWNSIAETHESTIPLNFYPHIEFLPRMSSILELGCGYGRILKYLHQLGFVNVIGVDGASSMLERCICAGQKNVMLGEVTNLPFPSNSFDCVICIGTLSSVSNAKDRSDAISEIARVLKSGGVFLFRDFMVTLSIQRILRYSFYFVLQRPWGNFVSREGIEFHHFSLREVRSMLGKHFVITSLTRESFITMHSKRSKGITVVARKEANNG